MKVSNSQVSFRAGLTKNIQAEINSCNVKKISKELAKANIKADFRGNKVVAWCCFKCFEIFKKLGLSLPDEIFVEDFKKLNGKKPETIAFNEVDSCITGKKNEFITLKKSIFFDEYARANYLGGWETIDSLSDEQFALGSIPTDNFLSIFLHEFARVSHEQNLVDTIGVFPAYNFDVKINNSEFRNFFKERYYDLFVELSEYALYSPKETLANDLSKRIVKNLDDKLELTNNFIDKSPYKKMTSLEKVFGFYSQKTVDNVIRRIWYGKI